jgi:hypothetical protein
MVIASCQDSSLPTDPTLRRVDGVTLNVEGEEWQDYYSEESSEWMDCQLSPSQCSKIWDAIIYLLSRPDAMCEDIGREMHNLFMSPPGSGRGFKISTQSTGSMGVKMKNGQPTQSGWASVDGSIYVRSGGLWESASNNAVGGLLAHERAHLTGEDCDGPSCNGTAANTGMAMYYQNSCGSET